MAAQPKMSGSQRPELSGICNELKIKIWKNALGSARIHILYAPPVSPIQMGRGYACPIYQVIDAETGEPPKDSIQQQVALQLTNRAARDILGPEFVRADLWHFDPGNQTGIQIPSTEIEADIFARSLDQTWRLVEGYLRWWAPWVDATVPPISPDIMLADAQYFVDEIDQIKVMGPCYRTRLKLNFRSALREARLWRDAGASAFDDEWCRRLTRRGESMTRKAVRHSAYGLHPRDMSFDANANLLGQSEPYRQAELDLAQQKFVVTRDRDLVYMADPRYQNCSCGFGTHLGAKRLSIWHYSLEELRGPNRPGIFAGTRLKDVRLVVVPRTASGDGSGELLPWVNNPIYRALERDEFGFVEYAAIYEPKAIFTGTEKHLAWLNYEILGNELRSMIKEDANRDISVLHVVDLDCERTGMAGTTFDGWPQQPQYKRFER
ncbi:hypothetical protein F4777DRAFT_575277 [Nemania sp. FL0916]|nr:hypothetical protein F4777DRAFT_575277 [Nemania sp. FL0916]